MSNVESYRDLLVWQVGIRITISVYRVSRVLPADERFGLVSQIRRSAVSIPSNIAEGHARESTKDFLRHLSIARGSLAELETQLLIAKELGMLSDETLHELKSLCDDESRMLAGLQRSLRQRLQA